MIFIKKRIYKRRTPVEYSKPHSIVLCDSWTLFRVQISFQLKQSLQKIEGA